MQSESSQQKHDDEKTEDIVSQPSVSGDPIKSAEETRLVRKLDRRILPITCLLYLFAYLDRSNLGNARLQGLPKDILGGDPTGHLFDWVNSSFFFAYILCQVPATVGSKLFPPRIWMASVAFGWGLIATLMSTTFNFPSILVTRIFLGTFEAGFGPAIPLYFSFFYTKTEMGLRMAYWFGFAAVAGAFGGIIAFGVQEAHVSIANWRLLFIIEGVPAILLGIVAMLFLPNRPESTSYLTEDERAIAIERMSRGTSGDTGAGVNKAHIKAAFKDWKVYVGGIVYFGLNTSLSSLSAFLPTILKTFGFTNARAQLLTVPPYATASVVIVMFCFASDRFQSRGIFIAIASFIGGIGYLILIVSQNIHARYFATFCICSGTYTAIGLTIAWYAHNLGSETKRAAGIPLFMSIGQCGSVLGSHIFPATESPKYIKGFSISCALEFLSCLCAIILSISYRLENRRRDKIYGKGSTFEKVDVHELADKAPGFRYLP